MTDTAEIGSVGYDDAIYELTGIDRLPALRGKAWFDTVREMTEQDATVGAVMFAVEMAMRAVPWSGHAADEGEAAQAEADFLEQCFDDMPDAWPNIVADALTYVTYGYSLFELVYKQRLGKTTDPATTSNYDDGRIGWRKWAFRPQATKERWVVKNGDVIGWVQRLPRSYQTVEIPAEKFIVFRSSARGGQPEGVSILKRAYRAYYYKRETEVQEAIAIGRELAGLPVMRVPANILNPRTDADTKAQRQYVKMLRFVHRGVQEGMMLPSTRDETHGEYVVGFELVSSSGARQIDTTKVIERQRTDIAMTLLADFVLVGHQQVGTYSVSESKVDTFTRALGGWLDMMEEAINEQAVSRLYDLNDVPKERRAKWRHGDVSQIDLKVMGEFLEKMFRSKALPPTRALAKWIAENIGTPVPTDEELDKLAEAQTAPPPAPPVPPVPDPNAPPPDPGITPFPQPGGEG